MAGSELVVVPAELPDANGVVDVEESGTDEDASLDGLEDASVAVRFFQKMIGSCGYRSNLGSRDDPRIKSRQSERVISSIIHSASRMPR